MKSIRAVKRTKLAQRIFRAPIILIAVILSALLGLSSCGGGESVKSNGDDMLVMPGGKFYGAISSHLAPNEERNCGFAVGIATGYTSREAAKSAAERQCRSAGGSDCTLDVEFGSAFRGENACGALVYGHRADNCSLTGRSNATQEAAKAEAIAACETSAFGRTKGLDCSNSLVSVCSTSGPASSFSRSPSGSSSGGPGGGGTPQIARTFNDVTIPQGHTLTWSNVSGSFSDPDGDRLKITAQSNHPYATARISGDDLIVKGVTAFTDGAVTITVTATDPGGLSVSQRFAVRVTGSDGNPIVNRNQAPQIRNTFADVNMRQGSTTTFNNVSTVFFSDPNNDRLRITASSNSPTFASVRLSGDDLIITGERGFTTGAVTITVTATDPGGLSVSQRIIVRVTGSGGNPIVNPGGRNQAPQIRNTFADVNIKQGSTSTFRNVSTVFFSDPNNDRLRITATSSSSTYASVRISGDDLIIKGERGFTTGQVIITVTATDPGGLSVSQRITVRVTATEVRTSSWTAISVSELFRGCTRRGLGWSRGLSKQAAEQAALAECNIRSRSLNVSCFSSRVRSTTGCIAYAEGDRCGGYWATGSTLVSARNSALAGCRGQSSNCSVRRSDCASN